MKKSLNNTLKIIISLFVGSVLFAFAHPNFLFSEGLPIFAWVCFVPVLWAIHKSSLKFAWAFGFFYGFVSYALLVFWLFNYSPLIFFAALLFYAACYAVLFEFMKLADFVFQKGESKQLSWVFNSFVLISFEYIKTKGFLGLSYGVIGYTQWKEIPLIQVANIAGVFGVSALIILCSGLLYGIIIRLEIKKDFQEFLERETHSTAYSPVTFATKIEKRRRRTSFVFLWAVTGIWVVLIVACIVYGNATKFNYDESEKIKIAAIQHNENSREDGFDVYAKNVRTLVELTNDALDFNSDVKIVVWPETSVVPSIMYQYYSGTDSSRKNLVNALLEYINIREQTFVIGNFHREKTEFSGGMATETKDYNSALVFTPKKNVIPPNPESYYKMHLVPLSEEFPYAQKFPKIAKKLESLGGTFWDKGSEYKVFEFEDRFCFSTPICFENTFPEIAREMYKAGSRCLISLTNDSWAKSEAAQNQHLSMAVFRSVENKIPGVISATSGVTCAINSDGMIIKSAVPFVGTYCVSEIPIVPKERKSTVYTEYGDIIGNVSVIISLAVLIIGLITCIIKICQSR